MNITTVLGKIAVIAGLAGVGICPAESIEASQPTHYFYTPTGYINDDFDVVAGLHEVSFTLPHRLQLHTSFLDNVGRICFGARYGILDNLNVGAGLAWSFFTFPEAGHAVHREFEPRFGTFLTWAPVIADHFEMSLTPSMQIGDHFSMSADYGMMITPSDFWSIIGEFGFSYDFTDEIPYFNTIWGVRIHPPQIPYLSFDGGIDFVEEDPDDFAQNFAPFFDVIFTMKTAKYFNR